MNFLMLAVAATAIFVVIVFGALALATRVTYGFRWRAIIGLETQVKRGGVMYVSCGPFAPTPVFWLGGKDWQEDAVARAVADGKLPRVDFTRAVSDAVHWDSICKHVPVWPSTETKRLFGDPEDVAEGENVAPLYASTASDFAVRGTGTTNC